MKKRTIILSGLIALVLIAMFLPRGYKFRWATPPGTPPADYSVVSFVGGTFMGSPYFGISFILALAAFVCSFFNRKNLLCQILCGVLLLVSAGFCFFDRFPKFRCFTALTWGIFGALVLLGLWTLFFIKTERKATVK